MHAQPPIITIRHPVYALFLAGLVTLFSACGDIPPYGGHLFDHRDSGPRQSIPLNAIPDAMPHTEARSKYGNGNAGSYVVRGQRYTVLKDSKGYVERGIASWYGNKFHGRLTSSREPYDMYAMTAAHKSLPLPTYVYVKNLSNGRHVIVRVNDRGPFVNGRIIDLSYAAANRLGIDKTGTAMVEVRTIDPEQPPALAQPPSLSPTTQARTALYVQIGAFGTQANAEMARQQLMTRFPELMPPRMTQDPDTALFRVRIGPLPSTESADRVMKILSSGGFRQTKRVAE